MYELYEIKYLSHQNLGRNKKEKNLITEYNRLLEKYNKIHDEEIVFGDDDEIVFGDEFFLQLALQEEIEKFTTTNNKKLNEFFAYEKEYYKNILLLEKYEVHDDNVYIDTYHENYNLSVNEYNSQVDEVNKIIEDYLEYFIIEYNNKYYSDASNFFRKLSRSDIYFYYTHNENDDIFCIKYIIEYIKQKFNDIYYLREKILYYKNKIDIQEKRLKMVNHNNCYEYNDCYAKDISNYRSWDNEDYNWTFDPQ